MATGIGETMTTFDETLVQQPEDWNEEKGGKWYPDPDLGKREWTALVNMENMRVNNRPLSTWKTDSAERVTDEYLAWAGYYGFVETDPPEHDVRSQKAVETDWVVDEENREVIQQWEIVDLTEEERSLVVEEKWGEIRSARDTILRETDWSQLPDAPIDQVTVNKYRKFRKDLRDVTKQSDDPFEIIMPTME